MTIHNQMDLMEPAADCVDRCAEDSRYGREPALPAGLALSHKESVVLLSAQVASKVRQRASQDCRSVVDQRQPIAEGLRLTHLIGRDEDGATMVRYPFPHKTVDVVR